MPIFRGEVLDAAACHAQIARLESFHMSSYAARIWTPLLLREIASCVFLRHGGKCRDDIDMSIALFEATINDGVLSLKWAGEHLYFFCFALRILFEGFGKGEKLPNRVQLRLLEDPGLERDASFLARTALDFAQELVSTYLRMPNTRTRYIDESISLIRAAYISPDIIRRETRLTALKALAMYLVLRFRNLSRTQDIEDAVEYAYMMFDVSPSSTDLLPVLDLCLRELHPTNLSTLELADSICRSMSQRSRVHAIAHRAILVLWFGVLTQHLSLTGKCESLPAFRLSVDKTVLSEDFPENDKAELLRNAGALLYLTCFRAPHGCAGQMHEAASYLHAALTHPGCPTGIRSMATDLLRSLHKTRHSYSHHPRDFEQVSHSLTTELTQHVESGPTGLGLASGTMLKLLEHHALSAEAITGPASPEITLHRLDIIVYLVHMLEALYSSDPEQRARYLHCAAVCHLQRYKFRNKLVKIRVCISEAIYNWRLSTSPQEVEEDYASVISFARELVTIATVGGSKIGCRLPDGVSLFYNAVDLKYGDPRDVWQPKLEEIDEAIALVSSPNQDTYDIFGHRTLRSTQLVNLLMTQSQYKYDPAVIEDIIRRITSLLEDPSIIVEPRRRMELALLRAMFKERMAHPDVSQAFLEGLELSEDVISSAPTLEAQFKSLKKLSGYFLVAVNHAMNRGELRAVVELLEEGRGLLWTQMRRFRTSVDPLVDSTDARSKALGEAYLTTSLELETLVMSAMPEDHIFTAPQSSVSPVLARMADKTRLRAKLADIRNGIRTCPGFEDFLRLPPFGSLQQAAIEGPVVMVSCNPSRSFVLILLSHRDPVCIDLNHTTYNQLCTFPPGPNADSAGILQLSVARTDLGPASRAYDAALKDVLETSAKLIVGPVIDKLERLGFDPGAGKRIWWCPTGPACMIPLHAAGPFTKPYKGKYLPDLYTSSYTPSLSALIEARAKARTSVSSSDTTSPTMLIVGQPGDPSLINADEEIHTVLSLLPLNTTPTLLLDEDASLAAVRSAMNDHSWLHMACHGLSDHEVPTQSAFQLSGDDKLTLRDIIKLRLPRAEFAFLSACSTAEFNLRPAGGTLEGESFDEVFHLSAAMQFCGFRGVVGTMWTVNDEDGVEVARHFYRELSRKGGEVGQVEGWNPRDAASALNKAVRKLKRKLKGERGSLERWVNFIHVGI